MLDKEDVRDKVLWFCESCESANKITDLNCEDCGTPLKDTSLVFNFETFSSVKPGELSNNTVSYFQDGGVSVRGSKPFSAVWAD